MKADISVIIPCYNAEKFISETLESILNQTMKCKEIIVVDDGSKDNTLNILKKFGSDIKIISINNSGVSIARNTGIKASSCQYIAFCDADDIWLPEKTEKQYHFMQEKDIKFSSTNAHIFGKSSENFEPLIPPSNPIRFIDLLKCNYIFTSSVLLHKEIFQKSGLFWEKLRNNQDWHLWLKIALHYDLYFLNEKLIHYRMHQGGISKKFIKSIDYFLLLLEDILNRAPQYSYLKKDIINSFIFSRATIAYYYQDYKSSLQILLKLLQHSPLYFKAYKYLLLGLIRNLLKFK